MIYLDNAATSYPKPPTVTEAVRKAMTVYAANPGRGGHQMSIATAEEIYRCRMAAANLFHLDNPAGVVFTANCTMALNMVIKGLLRNGGRAVISGLEHNSVVRPLHALKSPYGQPVFDIAKVVPGDDQQTLRNFRNCITPYTKAIICLHASNVFGTVLPIRQLGKLAHDWGLLFVVDGAQTAGMLPIDMQEMGIDFLCLPGHKGLYGPAGTGLLLCNCQYLLPALIEGGTGVNSLLERQPDELPERLESGTLNTVGICGLRAGIEWVSARGVEAIGREEIHKLSRFYDMVSHIPGVRLYTPPPVYGQTAPLLSLNIEGLPSETVAAELNKQGIAVRAGLHCSPYAHRQFGTLPTGTVRISPSVFTKPAELERTAKYLRQIAMYR